LDYLKSESKIKKEAAIEGNMIKNPIEIKPDLTIAKEKP